MIFNLNGILKHYDWGTKGHNNLISNYYYSNKYNERSFTDTDLYFAELWIGNHERGTSNVLNSELSIKNIIEGYASKAYKKIYNNDLPFMVKLISIGKPLSIQLHPDKIKATELHRKSPDIYSDANHKYEMAVALDDNFELLYGFDSEINILNKFKCFPTLLNLFNNKIPTFLSILDSSGSFISQMVKAIKDDLFYQIFDSKYKSFFGLIRYLINARGDDIGVIIAFYMKHLCLKKGEAISIIPNILHSYVKGEIVEIMSKSDNVIRVGLTTKFIDIDTIKTIINKSSENPVDIIKPTELIKDFLFYKSVATEFILFKPLNQPTYFNPLIIPNKDKLFPLIIIVLEGEAIINNTKKAEKGDTLFIPSSKVLNICGNIDIICATVNRF
jgi:mannose-6-phosphate isomerase